MSVWDVWGEIKRLGLLCDTVGWVKGSRLAGTRNPRGPKLVCCAASECQFLTQALGLSIGHSHGKSLSASSRFHRQTCNIQAATLRCLSCRHWPNKLYQHQLLAASAQPESGPSSGASFRNLPESCSTGGLNNQLRWLQFPLAEPKAEHFKQANRSLKQASGLL